MSIEYKVVAEDDRADLETRLNELGKDGWQMCHYRWSEYAGEALGRANHRMMVFMRAAENQS